MQINATQAIVKTMSVEIKAMVINNKQVTLAVFRQMDSKSVVDYENKKLNGVVWGRVNYHPDKCDHDGHLHVVWSDGHNLYRDRVNQLPLEAIAGEMDKTRQIAYGFYLYRKASSIYHLENFVLDTDSAKQMTYALSYDEEREFERRAIKDCKSLLSFIDDDDGTRFWSTRTACEYTHRECAKTQELIQNIKDQYKFASGIYEKLQQLDQLYIAV